MRNNKTKDEKHGLFIVFEGIDGSGKSTQARKLSEYFQKNNIPVLLTNEPSNSDVGSQIRKYISTENISQEELAGMFIDDRKLHLEKVIVPALKEGKHVVCDRYLYSNIAYQGASGLSIDSLKEQNKAFLKPDHLFFFQINVALALQRVQKRNETHSIFEKKKFLEKVSEIYSQLHGEEGNSTLIDAERSVDDICREIRTSLSKNKGDKGLSALPSILH